MPRALLSARVSRAENRGKTEADINNFLEIVSSYSYFSLYALYNRRFAHPRRDLSRSSSQIFIFFHPFFPPFPSPSFRLHRTEYRIRGLGECESSWPHRRSDANDPTPKKKRGGGRGGVKEKETRSRGKLS